MGGTGLDLDLIQQTTYYNVMPPGTTTGPTWASAAAADGAYVTNTPYVTGTGGSPGVTQLLQFNDPTFAISTNTPMTLRIELRRRADLNRLPALPGTNSVQDFLDNPWIVVDYMDIPVSVLALKMNGSTSDYSQQIQYQLGNLASPPAGYNVYATYGTLPAATAVPTQSTERSQPMYHALSINNNGAPMTPNGGGTAASGTALTLTAPLWQGNSFGANNVPPNVIVPHNLWQPHYDRDFASVAELFDVPLYGPYGPPMPTSATVTTLATGLDSGTGPDSVPGLPNWGLAYRMGSRTTELGAAVSTLPTTTTTPTTASTDALVGADWNATNWTPTVPNVLSNPPLVAGHNLSFGTAGYRILHPEGQGNYPLTPTADLTVNRWHRVFELLEVPTCSHRGLEENASIPIAPYQIAAGTIPATPGNAISSLGFYRTPGKININTLRYPEVVAGLVNETDIFTMLYTLQQTPGGASTAVSTYVPVPPATTSTNLSFPYLLPDASGDAVTVPPPQNPAVTGPVARDWWLQFIAARDGSDPLPNSLGGTATPTAGIPAPRSFAPRNAPVSLRLAGEFIVPGRIGRCCSAVNGRCAVQWSHLHVHRRWHEQHVAAQLANNSRSNRHGCNSHLDCGLLDEPIGITSIPRPWIFGAGDH